MATPASTPQGYHRILSPTLRIPQDPQLPIPVGILACQRIASVLLPDVNVF